MIKNFKIYDRTNASLSDSKTSDNLFCDIQIDILGNSAHLKTVQLMDVISLLNKIVETSVIYGADEYSFQLKGKHNYLFNWSRKNIRSTEHQVSIHSNEIEIVNTQIWTGDFAGSRESFYLRLMKEFLDLELFDYAKRFGKAFFKNNQDIDFKYNIADKVETVLNDKVRTKRVGFIIYQDFHLKEKSNMYHMMIDGKLYKKRYFEKDLKLLNANVINE